MRPLPVFFGLVLLAAVGCEEPGPTVVPPSHGETLFQRHCILCHGRDGRLGLNGAGDLTRSVLTLEERVAQVTRGKGLMTPFSGILSPEDIREVAKYTLTLDSLP